jgi:zinc transporter 1
MHPHFVHTSLHSLQLSTSNSTDSRYSYGWHRAEILAALVNGVFLLALCFSIFLEAIGRFFTAPGTFGFVIILPAYLPTDISNPRLIVVVGALGLASNLVGLFLFHGDSSVLLPGFPPDQSICRTQPRP